VKILIAALFEGALAAAAVAVISYSVLGRVSMFALLALIFGASGGYGVHKELGEPYWEAVSIAAASSVFVFVVAFSIFLMMR
jgi:hypothetical protein